jgi:hypothetical protein
MKRKKIWTHEGPNIYKYKKKNKKIWTHEGLGIEIIAKGKKCEHMKAHAKTMFLGQVPFGYSWSLTIAG